MPILFNEQTKELQLYYGKKIRHNDSFAHLLEERPRPLSACAFEGNMSFSMEHIKQEYPCYGTGDFKYPAYEILQQNGSDITNFEYVSHCIYNGKPRSYIKRWTNSN